MINVCMVARDRPELTEKTINSYLGSRAERHPVTIVDDASQDDTRQLLEWFAYRYDFQLIRNDEPRGVGGAKNQCVEASAGKFGHGRWLFLCDNDVQFQTYAIEDMVETYRRHAGPSKIRLLGGYAHPFNGTIRQHSVVDESVSNETRIVHDVVHEKNAVDGLSWLMEWDTWKLHGKLMDNARGVRQSEDWEYCQRIRKAGYRVGVVWPHVVRNLGVVDTFGEEIPGADEVRKQQGMEPATA